MVTDIYHDIFHVCVLRMKIDTVGLLMKALEWTVKWAHNNAYVKYIEQCTCSSQTWWEWGKLFKDTS